MSSIEEVQDYATQSIWLYNNERPNMALGGFTPKQQLALAAKYSAIGGDHKWGFTAASHGFSDLDLEAYLILQLSKWSALTKTASRIRVAPTLSKVDSLIGSLPIARWIAHKGGFLHPIGRFEQLAIDTASAKPSV